MRTIFKSAAKAAALTLSTVAVMLGLAVSSYAANGDNGLYFYDFEDYEASSGSGLGPDKYIGVADVTDNGKKVFQYKNFGSAESGDEHGGVLKLDPTSFPSFIFPEAVNSGKVRICFDMKINDPQRKLHPAIFAYAGTDPQINRSYEAHLMAFNSKVGGAFDGNVYYAKYFAAWNATNVLPDFNYEDAQEWNHYEFLISELNVTGSPTLDGYINGKLMFSGMQLNSTNKKNLRTFGIWFESGYDGASIYLDNFYVKRYTGETSFKAETYGESRFSVTNGIIKVAMTERSKEPVTKENITITNNVTGAEVTDFDVLNYTGRTFDIKINETVEYGRYDISFNGVTGQLSDTELSGKLVADTEYKTASITTEESNGFDDYTDTDGTLPEGFICLEEGTELFATSTDGKDGGHAFGFANMAGSRTIKRAMYQFASPIECKEGLDVSFDAYVSDAKMYFYLADEGDFETSNPDYKENALICIDKYGEVYYADGRTDSPTSDIGTGLSLTPGEWHSIKVRIVPDNDEDKSYLYISADDGEEFRCATTRQFHKGSAYGYGVGYLSTSAEADIRIDNVNISGSITAYYPQVESIVVYDGLGNTVDLSNNPTAMISEIRADFNTYVSHNLDGLITVTEDGSEMPLDYEIIDDNNTYKSTLVIRFDGLLNPLREYNIQINEGIPSAYSDEVTSFLTYNTNLVVNNELGFKCIDSGYDSEEGVAKVTFSKNNSDEGSYIYAVAGYNRVTVKNDAGEDTETLVLVGMDYTPITISANDMGKIEYKVKYNGSEAEEYKTFLWKYPKLAKVEYGLDGSIE